MAYSANLVIQPKSTCLALALPSVGRVILSQLVGKNYPVDMATGLSEEIHQLRFLLLRYVCSYIKLMKIAQPTLEMVRAEIWRKGKNKINFPTRNRERT